MERSLRDLLELSAVRATVHAAVAAARLRGHGNEKMADQAAVDAMRRQLNLLPIRGTVVIGEGERDEAPMLFIGEKTGAKKGIDIDIAVDPLECTDLCAKDLPGAMSVIAMAEAGNILNAPDVYMEQIAIGPGYMREGIVDLDYAVDQNICRLAKAKGVRPHEITVATLDRTRHADMIGSARKTGASVRLRAAGNIGGIIHTCDPDATDVDLFVAYGGAPEGVLAAAALRCLGGHMQARLILDTEEKRERATKMGIKDLRRKYSAEDLVGGDCVFAATGVTDSSLLRGVRFTRDSIQTETVLMACGSGLIQWVRRDHRDLKDFEL